MADVIDTNCNVHNNFYMMKLILISVVLLFDFCRAQAPTICNALVDFDPAAENTLQNSDYYTQTAKGLNAGNTAVTIFGALNTFSAVTTRNLLSDNGAAGSTAWSVPTGSSVAQFVSSNAADDNSPAPGTGCRSILVEGLNAAGAAISESLALNGAVPVTTVNTYSFVNKITCESVGTSLRNLGRITGVASGIFTASNLPAIGLLGTGFTSVAGNAVAPFGTGVTTSAIYRVPTGSTFLLKTITLTSYRITGANGLGTMFFIFYKADSAIPGSPYRLYNTYATEPDGTPTTTITLPFGTVFTAGTTIWVEALVNVAGSPTTAQLQGVLY